MARRTATGKYYVIKAFNISKKTKCDRYQKGLASMVYKFFDKRASGSNVKNEKMPDQRALDLAHVAKVSDHT